MKKRGLTDLLAQTLPDKRRDNSHIPFDILLYLAVAAKLKCKTSLTDVPFAVTEAESLADGHPCAPDSQKLLFSAIIEPGKIQGGSGMALEYTEEKLNSLDKETIIQLFLSQQEQLKQIDHNLQLVLEQLADLKRRRFGRSSERHETGEQISFMEVDGKIVFFNEAEAVSMEEPDDSQENIPRQRPKKKQEKREEGLEGLPAVVVEHSMDEKELEEKFGQEGWKQLPDEIYRRYRFTPAKIVVVKHLCNTYG